MYTQEIRQHFPKHSVPLTTLFHYIISPIKHFCNLKLCTTLCAVTKSSLCEAYSTTGVLFYSLCMDRCERFIALVATSPVCALLQFIFHTMMYGDMFMLISLLVAILIITLLPLPPGLEFFPTCNDFLVDRSQKKNNQKKTKTPKEQVHRYSSCYIQITLHYHIRTAG